MRATPLFVMALLASANIARAQQMEVVSPQPDSVSVTIYRDLFALVTETRTVDLPEGPVTLSFEGVVETLLPQSAALSDIGRALAERNFDYDALSPNNLLTRSIGKSVTITRTLPGSGRVVQTRATIVAANDGGITLQTVLGNEALHCSGLPERLTFDEVPADLHARPKLSIQLAAGKPGKRTLRLSYLAHGFAWKSAYVAQMNATGNRMDLTGWITLQNYTQASFRGAQVQVVAGKLHLLSKDEGGSSLAGDTDDFYDEPALDEAREEARTQLQEDLEPKDSELDLFSGCHALPVPPGREDHHFEELQAEEVIVTGMRMNSLNSPMSMGSIVAVREELGDYQLYRLPFATDLNARQTKQAVFLVKPHVKIERFYRFGFDVEGVQYLDSLTPDSVIAFENRKTSGLGEPLPAGQVRVFESGGGSPVFIGEGRMSDKPVNVPVELDVAKALDLGLEIDATSTSPEQLRGENLAKRADVEVRAFSAKDLPVILEIRQSADSYPPGAAIVDSSEKFARKDGNFVWRLLLPANGIKMLTYRVETPLTKVAR